MSSPSKLALTSLILLVTVSTASAEEATTRSPTSSTPEVARAATATLSADVIDHRPFDALLKKHVDARGQVAYGAWARAEADRAALKSYVDAVGLARVEGKSEASRLAFYINAYNAIVLNAVLEKWPIESVMKVEGFFTAEKHRVANEEMTLDDLEHNKIIRVQFAEPRIHFVLVCAAKSCPPLLRTAMTEANLEQTLEAATRTFIGAATRRQGDKVITSQLFNWFRQDFEKNAGSVPAYLAKYTEGQTQELLATDKVTIEFSDYDWAVNAR
jgi:hypothetical protein